MVLSEKFVWVDFESDTELRASDRGDDRSDILENGGCNGDMGKFNDWVFLFLSILGVNIAFSKPVGPEKVDSIPGRYQGVRIGGVQGGMFVVDTATAKVKFCGVTPVRCTAWKN